MVGEITFQIRLQKITCIRLISTREGFPFFDGEISFPPNVSVSKINIDRSIDRSIVQSITNCTTRSRVQVRESRKMESNCARTIEWATLYGINILNVFDCHTKSGTSAIRNRNRFSPEEAK